MRDYNIVRTKIINQMLRYWKAKLKYVSYRICYMFLVRVIDRYVLAAVFKQVWS